MEKQNNVPKLRFPEFSDGWEMKKLGEVAAIYDGTHQTPNYVNSGVKFVSVENINDIENTNKFITTDAFEKEYKIKPKKDDILMTRITAGIIGATAVVKNNDPLGYYVSLALIRIKNDYDVNFLCQRIESREFKHELHKRIIHVAFPKKINLGDISDCNVYYTTLPEQTKIADFLSAVDKKLSLLKKKKSLLEVYKKGVMQKIFNLELRFKKDDGSDFEDWEEKRLGEVGTFFSGGTPLTTKRQYFGGEIAFIRSGEINSNKTEQFITDEGLKNSSAKMVEIGDLLYALYGATSGEVAISKIKGAINQAVLCIRTDLDNRFLHNFLLLNKEIIIKTYLQGGQGNLSGEIIKSVTIPIPTLPEQEKIANFLSSIDAKIGLEVERINHLEGWKKGLLQGMFV